jgi:hypothetical protein
MKKSVYRGWHLRRHGRPSQGDAVALPAAAPPAAVKPTERKRRLWVILLVCLLGSGAASFVVFKYILPGIIAPSIPRELLGTWAATEGDLKGVTLEFRWYGTAVATSYRQGKKEIINYSVEVEDETIFLTDKHPAPGMEETLIQTIVKLTDNELIIRDADQKTYRMIRVRN